MSIIPTPSVTLSEVLQFALPDGSRVLSCPEHLARRIHWARLLGARPSGLGAVEPGELLLLSNALITTSGDARVLSRLLAELVEAGAAGFVLAGEPNDAVPAACRANDVPLLQVPAGAQLGEVERAIIGLILDRDGQLRRRAEEIHEKLLATMLASAGLSGLLAALVETTGLRAAVFDDYLALQGCAPEDDEFRRTVVSSAETVFARELSPAAARPGRPLAFGFTHDGTVWRGHLFPLEIGGAWAGYLGLLGGQEQTGELDRLLAERASTLVALELARQRAIADATQRGRGELLADLLDGSFPSVDAILGRGQQLGYDLQSPHLVFLLAADWPVASDAGPDARLGIARQRRRFAEVARATLLRLQPRSLTLERGGAIVGLLPTARPDDSDAAIEMIEHARLAVAAAIPEAGVSAGLGRPMTHPSAFAQCHGEAERALAIAQRLLGGGRTVHYGTAGIERLLVHLLGNPELEQFASDTLGELLIYDQQHRGELVHTLDVFLRCNGNHVRAAEQLHLHRNTLLYRLERAREILGRELEDAETRLALQVALRIRGALPTAEAAEAPPRVAARRRRAG